MIPARHRATLALALIGIAVLVAVIGWFGVSGETEVAFQLPYLASAGVAALLLLGAGSALLVSAQLESDRAAQADMEAALRDLAGEVARLSDQLTERRGSEVSAPSRLRAVRD